MRSEQKKRKERTESKMNAPRKENPQICEEYNEIINVLKKNKSAGADNTYMSRDDKEWGTTAKAFIS